MTMTSPKLNRRANQPPTALLRLVRRYYFVVALATTTAIPITAPEASVFGSIEARREFLSTLPQSTAKAYCRARPVCAYDPVTIIDGGERLSGQTSAQQGLAIWNGVNAYMASGEKRHLELSLEALKRWVRADAIKATTGNQTRARHYIKRTLFPAITAYGIMRDVLDIKDHDRTAIETWLGRGVAMMDQDNVGGSSHSDTNNSRYSRDAVNMAWGIIARDQVRINQGIARYRAALNQMRPDGSLPQETARGTRGLTYQNLAISILISIAEMAHGQGVDLYAEADNGRDIHKAIAFLITAESDPAVIQAYAQAPQKKLRLGNHLHWTEIYLARFPDHPNAKAIRDIRRRYFFRTGRANDFVGGNLSCLFADPKTHDILTKGPPADILTELRKDAPAPILCPRYLD